MSDLSPLSQRLLSRATAPVGVIDVHQPRERHDRAKALLRSHVTPVAHLFKRAGEEATPAAATGFVFVAPAVAEPPQPQSGESPRLTGGPITGDPALPRDVPVARTTRHPGQRDDTTSTASAESRALARRGTRPSAEPAAPLASIVSQPASVRTVARSPRPFNVVYEESPVSFRRVQHARIEQEPMAVVRSKSTTPVKTDSRRIDVAGSPADAPDRRQVMTTAGSRDVAVASTVATPAALRADDVAVSRPIATARPSASADATPADFTLARPAAGDMQPGVARTAADAAVRTGNSTATFQQVSAGTSLSTPALPIQRVVPALPVATAASAASAGPLPLHSVNTSRIATAIVRTASTAEGTPAQPTSAVTVARSADEPRTVTSTATALSPAPDRQNSTGGGVSFSPDRMMSHMLRRIAIERERRGGGRWP